MVSTAVRRYDEHQGSILVARWRLVGAIMQEIRAGNEETYIRGQGFVRYAGQMIGSLVLCTAKIFLEQFKH